MKKFSRICNYLMVAALLPLALVGCTHKTLLEPGENPATPPVPGVDVVRVFVEWTNVKHLEQMGSGTFVLSDMYAKAGGLPTKLPFAASSGDGKLTGEVLSYGHCPEGTTCSHTLSLFVNTVGGKVLLKEVDVSTQMRVQRGNREIYLQLSDALDLSDSGLIVDPPIPDDEDVVRIFVRWMNISGLDKLESATLTLSGLYGSKAKEKMTLPFAGAVVDGMLAGDLLCYGYNPSDGHSLQMLLTLKDGSQRLVDADVSVQMERQRDADVVFLLVTDAIDLNDPDGPDPPAPEDDGVQIYVSCTSVRYAERIESGVFTLSGLYAAEDATPASLPFQAYVQGSTVAGHVYSYRHCPDDESRRHILTLLVHYSDGGEGIVQADVTGQMHAQRDADRIYIVISDDLVPQTPVDYEIGGDGEGGITPMQPGNPYDRS